MKSNQDPESNKGKIPSTRVGAPVPDRVRHFLKTPAVRYALLIYLASRIFLTFWAVAITLIQPISKEANETLRPYLDTPIIDEGPAGLLLGPWQRFDTMRYLRIARQGYEETQDSVFPPLYPLAINSLERGLAVFVPRDYAGLLAAIVISNVSMVTALILLYRLTRLETESSTALRTIIYFALFPSAFFLIAAYSESLFITLALATIYAARRDRFWLAGVLGFLACLTRFTGVFLVVPLLCEYLLQHGFDWRHPGAFPWRNVGPAVLGVFLPVAAATGFLLYRQAIGLPPINQVYRQYWYQVTGIPGRDMLAAVSEMVAGGAPFRLYIDFLSGIFLIATTWLALRRLRLTYGLYSLMLLFFIFLPTSELKPLFSFSRYVLAFFPAFILLGKAGKNPWINRLIVYPSLALYLFLSGQFFMWGWVA